MSYILSSNDRHGMPTSHRTYTRSDDRAIMVDVAPSQYVEEALTERLGLLR
jgi:hypothetical protein